MIDLLLNASLVLALLVAFAAALVVLAFTRPLPQERLPLRRRRYGSLRPSHPSSLRKSLPRRRRAA
jgi:hypothetical protein